MTIQVNMERRDCTHNKMSKRTRKNRILLLMATLSAITSQPSFAASNAVSTKTTATLAATCQISAQNVAFGPIDPRTSTSGVTSSSSMNLFCSKGASYTIQLGGANANYTVDGNYFGNSYSCPNNCSGIPYNYHYYYIYAPTTDYTQNPSNYTSRVLYYNGTYINNYNSMKGMVSGDIISYKITLPGDDTKIWNRGNYNYTTAGTGANQVIPIKATLTTTSYPTPDSYSDTVTATVTF
ncbi:spore coat protein U domain-containing protein [Ralstonia pseudosolanacearum]